MEQQDSANQTTFSNAGAVNWLASLDGFVDEGERCSYLEIADEIRDQPILDLGVGAGRTTPFLMALSSQYVAIDYLPIMVSLARRKFVGVDIRVGDARDLSCFGNESFALVVFSHAGMDAVDHADRQQIVAEVCRVLKPGGLFWFSTLNKDGGGPSVKPWPYYRAQLHEARTMWARLSATRELVEGYRNYRRLQSLRREDKGWLIAPFAAHAFGLLTHYVTFEGLREELTSAGFCSDIRVLDPRGIPVNGQRNLREVDVFHVIARKMLRASA